MTSQLFIISIADLKNGDVTGDQIASLKEIFSSFGSRILSKKTTICCLNYNECIDILAYLVENNQDFMSNQHYSKIVGYALIADFQILHDESRSAEKETINNSKIVTQLRGSVKYLTQMEIYTPESIFNSFKQEFGEIGENALIICDDLLFQNLSNFLNQTRNIGQLNFGVINLTQQEENLIIEGEGNVYPLTNLNYGDQESLSIKFEENLRKNILSNQFDNDQKNQQDVINNLSKFIEQLKEYQSHLLASLANSQGGVSYQEIMEIDKLVENQRKKIENIQKSIDYASGMSNTFADMNGDRNENDYLEIKKFHFDESLNNYKLQIENKTDFTFYNVTLVLLDDRNNQFSTKEICIFRIIEKQSKLWKELDLAQNEDYYGLHFTLIYRSQFVIREPFYIAPCKLYFKKIENLLISDPDPTSTEDAGQVEAYSIGFCLKNYSKIKFPTVILSLPETIEEEAFVGPSDFDYGVTWVTKFNIRKVFKSGKASLGKDYRVFACSGNKIISNTVTISGFEFEGDEEN